MKFTATRLGFWCQGGALLIILSLRSHSLNPIFSTTKHAKKFSFCEIYVPKVYGSVISQLHRTSINGKGSPWLLRALKRKEVYVVHSDHAEKMSG